MNTEKTKQLKELVNKIKTNPKKYTRDAVSDLIAIALYRQVRIFNNKDINNLLESITAEGTQGIILQGNLTGLKFNYNRVFDTYKGLKHHQSRVNKRIDTIYQTGIERWWGVDLSPSKAIINDSSFPNDINLLTEAIEELAE